MSGRVVDEPEVELSGLVLVLLDEEVSRSDWLLLPEVSGYVLESLVLLLEPEDG